MYDLLLKVCYKVEEREHHLISREMTDERRTAVTVACAFYAETRLYTVTGGEMC